MPKPVELFTNFDRHPHLTGSMADLLMDIIIALLGQVKVFLIIIKPPCPAFWGVAPPNMKIGSLDTDAIFELK
jgi:hypothetical protein